MSTTMTTAMQPKQQQLWDKAVCLSVVLRTPTQRRKVSNGEYHLTEEVEADAVSLTKRLWHSKEFSKIMRLDRQFKADLAIYALPTALLRGGIYPIPISLIDKVRTLLDEFMATRQEAVDAFLGSYQSQIDKAKIELKDLFKPSDYPAEYRLAKSFQVEYQWLTFNTPSALEHVSEEFFEKEKKRAHEMWSNATAKIEAAMFESFSQLLSHLANSLAVNPDGSRARLHKSTVDKVATFLSHVKDRNITNNDELVSLAAQADNIIHGVNVDDLRSDVRFRKQTADSINKIKAGVNAALSRSKRRVKFLEEEK